MIKILFILLFFPSITFSLSSAEVFPWGIIFSSYYILNNKTLSGRFICVFFIISSSAIVFGLCKQLSSDIFRSVAAYLNVISVYFVLINDKFNIENRLKIVNHVFIFLLLLGIFQSINLLFYLEPIIKLLVPRGNISSLSESRGVSLLSSEPSRAANELIFIYLVVRFFKLNDKKKIIFDMMFVLYLIVFIKSTTGVFLFFVFLIIYYLIFGKFKVLSLILGVMFLFLFFSFDISNSNIRAINVIHNLYLMNDFTNIYHFILNQSGFRVISMISAYNYGFTHFFGGGVGQWQDSSLIALSNINAYEYKINYFIFTCNDLICSVRPTSFISSLMLDVGWIFTMMILLLLFYKNIKITKENISYFLFFIFCLLFSSSVGNPIPWVCLCLIMINKDKSNA